MSLPVLSPEDFLKAREGWRTPAHEKFLVMYSSLWGGLVTDPTLWLVPADDHMVHRGDGVFEVCKCREGRVYSLSAHLTRLERSAEAVGLVPPPEFREVRRIVREVLRTGGDRNAQVRITISRGPGGFTSNPYECPKSLLIVTTTRLSMPPEEKYRQGASLRTAPFPAQPPRYARIKSCSYLHNVLVKKAAADGGADYGVCFDERGFLTEGSTENVAVISRRGELLVPRWDGILSGTTLARIMDHGRQLMAENRLTAVENRDISREEALSAAEVFVSSTTMDLMSIVKWDEQVIGDGRPGPVATELLARIRRETLTDNPHTTDMWAD